MAWGVYDMLFYDLKKINEFSICGTPASEQWSCSNKLPFFKLNYTAQYMHDQCKTSEQEDAYLRYINTNKYRISLTKFRLSAHDLAIEKGRH